MVFGAAIAHLRVVTTIPHVAQLGPGHAS